MDYKDQIKSPKWQKKRLEILKRDEFTCTNCGNKELTLHVHHKHYNKGAMIWDYQGWELTTLCETCHSESHKKAEIYNNTIVVDKKFSEIIKSLSYYDDKALNVMTHLLREIMARVDDGNSEYEEFWFRIFDSLNNGYIQELLKICDDHLDKNEILSEINLLKEELDKLKNIQFTKRVVIANPIISLKNLED